jgi:ABC-type lipoprotein release transport system permease subunit
LDQSFRAASQTTAPADIELVTSTTISSVAADIARIPNVLSVQPRLVVRAQWKTVNGYRSLDVVGVTMSSSRLNRFALVRGRLPQGGQVLMEDSDNALAPITIGRRVGLRTPELARTLEVSGFSRTPGRATPDLGSHALAYIALADAERIFRSTGPNDFLIRLRHYEQRAATAVLIGQILGGKHVRVLSSQVGRDGSSQHTVDDLVAVMWGVSILSVVAYALLAASSFRIGFAQGASVVRLLSTLGADRNQMVRSFLGGVAGMALLGTTVGLVTGLFVADVLVRYIAGLFSLTVDRLTVPPAVLVLVFGVGVGVPLVSAFLPLLLASMSRAIGGLNAVSSDVRLAVVQPAFGMGTVGRLPAAAGAIPLSALMFLRELPRRRGGSSLPAPLSTLAILSMAGAVFCSTEIARDALDRVVHSVPGAYLGDVFVSFPEPQSSRAVERIARSVPGVRGVERFSATRVTTRWGPAELTGVEWHPALYARAIVDGRWFRRGEQRVAILSEDAAHRSGLAPGATISFRDDLHTSHWRVIGISRDATGVLAGPGSIGAIVAPVDNVNRFDVLPALLAPDLVVSSGSPFDSASPARARRIDTAFAAAGYQTDVQTAREYEDRARSRLAPLYLGLGGAVIVMGLVAAVWTFTFLAIFVVENRAYLGMLRALGATPRDIIRPIGTQAALLGLLAWPFAVAVGALGAESAIAVLAHVSAPVTFSLSTRALLDTLVFILGTSALASVLPAWMAVRTTGQEVIRSLENPATTG